MNKRQLRMARRQPEAQDFARVMLAGLVIGAVLLAALVIAAMNDSNSHDTCLASNTCVELGQ